MKRAAGKFQLTAAQLRWIALLAMLLDHLWAMVVPGSQWMTYVGRIAFPIFAFQIAEGARRTSDFRRYALRLLAFACLSDIPFDLAFFGGVTLEHQNVFFTLLLGVGMMYMLERSKEIPLKVVEILMVMTAADFLRTDYGFRGIILIAVFYLLREKLWLKTVCGAVWNFLWNGSIQGYGALAMIPIAMYNGERGWRMKYFFYVFYPAHLLVLFLVHKYFY